MNAQPAAGPRATEVMNFGTLGTRPLRAAAAEDACARPASRRSRHRIRDERLRRRRLSKDVVKPGEVRWRDRVKAVTAQADQSRC